MKVTWDKLQGNAGEGDKIKDVGMEFAIYFWMLDPANIE